MSLVVVRVVLVIFFPIRVRLVIVFEIFRGLHLVQTRQRATECKYLLLARDRSPRGRGGQRGREQCRGLSVRGENQLDLVIVALVDQQNEATRLVQRMLGTHARHIEHEQRVIHLAQLGVVGHTEGRAVVAEFREFEPRDALESALHSQHAAVANRDLTRLTCALFGELIPLLFECARGLARILRIDHVVDVLGALSDQSVVHVRAHVVHVTELLQLRNERQEECALQSTLVEICTRLSV
jgi:hypothetical protein